MCYRLGDRNGNPLQYSCLENPRDRGVWWAAVYGVALGRTRLNWLSSSSYLLVLKHLLVIYRLFIHFEVIPPWGMKEVFLSLQTVGCLGLMGRQTGILYDMFSSADLSPNSFFSLCHAASVLTNSSVPITRMVSLL